ncbi:MAG TPA: M23 family metallopeptidase [Bacillales bacterium]|nr:M23 family metallopeptidase [Bacillales bacterium]
MKEDKKQAKRREKTLKWRKFARKRWVYPAVFLGFAAIVIASTLWMQAADKGDYSFDQPNGEGEAPAENAVDFNENPAVPVNQSEEVFKWPVKNKKAVHVQKKFFDFDASTEEQQAALVYHNHTYRMNRGINIASESGESFVVTAAMSGTVVQAGKDPLLGYVVKIDHGNGVTTLYQSLKSIAVEKGDRVEQGEKLGMAGKSELYKDAGVIAHFEIRKNGIAVNPIEYFGKSEVNVQTEEKSDNDRGDMKQDKDKKEQPDMKKDEGTSGGKDEQKQDDRQTEDSRDGMTSPTSKNA